MTDDIRALTARMADEPGSLAFLELAEALRRRGQLEAAFKVARGGLSRYPGLADAHDLMARVLSDQGDLAGAFDAWSSALQLDPMRTSALKGIAFLYFRAGDTAAALGRLTEALDCWASWSRLGTRTPGEESEGAGVEHLRQSVETILKELERYRD